jgi:hypothetical protein
MKRLILLTSAALILLSGCNSGSGSDNDGEATNTLAPIATRGTRVTATLEVTRTARPTFTYTPTITPIPPTATNSPTPSPTPPVIGVVTGGQRVNIRSAPDENSERIGVLTPGDGVEVLGVNLDSTWYNIQLEDGTEGWISAGLLRLEPTPTVLPSPTASPDMTALALGTPLPTALFGEGTITPTPPLSVQTPTPPGTPASDTGPGTGAPTEPFLPIRDPEVLNLTRTALAGGGAIATERAVLSPTPTPSGFSPNLPTTPGTATTAAPGAPTGTTAPATSGSPSVRTGVDVFAFCDTPGFGVPPAPTNIAAGSTIDIIWAWFATERRYIDDHVAAVTYEITVNDVPVDWRGLDLPTSPVEGGTFVKYWYVRYGPLQAGQYVIRYRATWSTVVFDGFQNFGPGTANPIEEGSCTITVR